MNIYRASRRLTLQSLTLALAGCLLASCATPRKSPAPQGLIHQVGFVWLKDAGSTVQRQQVINAVHTFAREIPAVKSAAVGLTDGIGGPFADTSYDVAFVLVFKDEASRQAYNTHPVHERAAKEVFLPLSRKLLFYRFVTE